MSAVSMTPPSLRPGSATISRTRRCPEASVPTCTTRSTLAATVGTTNDVPMFSPASKGSVHIFTTASRALLACSVHMPGSPLFNAISRHRRLRAAPGPGDRRAARPQRGRCHRDRRRLHHAGGPAGPRRRLPAARRAVLRRRFRPDPAARRRARIGPADGALLGLLLGVGLLLIWRSGSRAPRRRTEPRRPGARQQMLAAAGLTGLNSAQLFALQAGLAVLALVVVLLTTGTVTVSLVFGVFGFFLPIAQVRRLAARRRADLREVWPEVVDNLASAVRAGLSLPEA